MSVYKKRDDLKAVKQPKKQNYGKPTEVKQETKEAKTSKL